jgi:hypothetical protein
MVLYDVYEDDNYILKNNQEWGGGGAILPLKEEFVIRETEPPSCSSCKIYIF